MSREEAGRPGDASCPDWCVTVERHRSLHLRAGDTFWHESESIDVRAGDVDAEPAPSSVVIRLAQYEGVAEQGREKHPTRISLSEGSLTPGQARRVASALVRMAARAEETLANDTPREPHG